MIVKLMLIWIFIIVCFIAFFIGTTKGDMPSLWRDLTDDEIDKILKERKKNEK